MAAESMDLDSSVKIELLTLLHQRVDNRKADPNYKPVFGRTEPKTSRIPVKSTIGRRFEKAHQRQFTKQVLSLCITYELDTYTCIYGLYHNA